MEVYADESPDLIISNLTNIVSIDLDTTVVDNFGVHCYLVYGMDYDLVNRVFYWSEIVLGLIRRVSFNDRFNGSAVETIVTGLDRPEQIAIDWVHRKLYWTDFRRGVIERSDLDGSNIEIIGSGIIPQAVVIDPFHEAIYWTNYQTPRQIEKTLFNSIYKRAIVNVVSPSGLTIDYDNDLLYWTDDQLNQILSCDLGGDEIRIVPVSVAITNPYAVVIFQSNLYWTDRSESHIGVVDELTGVSVRNISASLNRSTDIDVIHSSRQPGVCKSH